MDIIDFLNGAGANATGGIISAATIALATKVKNAFKGKSITQETLDKLIVENVEIKNSVVKLQAELMKENIITNVSKNTGIIIPNGQGNIIHIYNNHTEISEQDINRKTLSDESLLRTMRALMSLSGRGLSESESLKAKNTREKILALFDIQLASSTIFDSIIESEQLQTTDVNDIQKLRNNDMYNYQDRSSIVSALTLASLNSFDEKKIHLLIDFLTDFEEITWQRALVGLLFAITRYNKLLKLPELKQENLEISRRLEELKSIPRIQDSIITIDDILRNGCYSMKKCMNCPLYKNKQDKLIQVFKMFFGKDITFNEEDIFYIQESLTRTDSIGALMQACWTSEKVLELANKIKNNDSFIMDEIFEYVDIENYIKLYELNPFALNLNDDLFSKPQKWFYPFKMDNKTSKCLAAKYPQNLDIEYTDFKNLIISSKLISDIDKVYILNHINELSKDFIDHIISLVYLLELFIYDEENEIKYLYIKIIRDLYRFSILFPDIQKGHFGETLKLYDTTILRKIATEVTKIKIEAQFLFQHNKYQKSIDVLHTIPVDKYDFEINALFAKNYIWLEQNNSAIPYLNKVLKQLDKCTLKEKVVWYKRAKNAYYNIDSNKYTSFLKKETSIREKIFKESLCNDDDEIIAEKGKELAECYFDFCVEFCNKKNDLGESLCYIMKYLNVFFLIPNIKDDKLHETLEIKKESLYALLSPKVLIGNFSYIQKKIKKEISKKLFDKINVLYETYSRFDNVNINNSKYYNLALMHSNEIYKIIFPVFQKIRESDNNKQYKNALVPFVSNTKMYNIAFPLDDVLEGSENIVFTVLLSNIRLMMYSQYLDLFFNQLLSEEFVITREIIIDKVLSELISWHIPNLEIK